MHPQTVLDFVVFHLTPTRTRCELYAAAGEETVKLASGILKPFSLHLKAVKEQLAKGGHSIRLQPPVHNLQQGSWFTKGTLRRFIRFVSNPDVLERVGTIEVELKQLEETARMQTRHLSKTHAQHLPMNFLGPLSPRGARRKLLGNSRKVFQKKEDSPGLDGNSILGNSRKRLLYALETRRTFLQKEQDMSFARATAAGFDDAHIRELISFSDCFGATRLREACLQFISLHKSRWETSSCAESMSTTTDIQFNSSMITGIRPRILCKSHTTDGSRVPVEGYEVPHDAQCPCTLDKENEICACQVAKGHPSSHSVADENWVPRSSYFCDEDFKFFTCSSWQKSPAAAEEGRCLSKGQGYNERERSSITNIESLCTSGCCNFCCCCHNPLRGLQAVHKVVNLACVAPCEYTTSCQCMLESEIPSLYLSSKVTNGEPLHELVSSPSRYLYNQESVSKLIVINNQIFSTSRSVDSSAKKDEAMEAVGKCCKQLRYSNEPSPFNLCVGDMVSSSERRCDDESVLQALSKKQESTNFHNMRKAFFERCSADSSFIGEEFQKPNGESKSMKIDGRGEILLNGTDACVSRVAPSEVAGREVVGSQCELYTISSHDPKLSKYNDKAAGSWNPLYQEFLGVPTDRSFWECTTEKISGGSSAKETTSELISHSESPTTDCRIQVPQTSKQAALSHQLISSVSRPSEERVKRFLERYYEKREEKLRNRFYAEKVKAGLTSKSALLFPDKEHAESAEHAQSTSNHVMEKPMKLSKRSAQAGKPQTYKEDTRKSKKSKDEEDQMWPEGLPACQRDRNSTDATAGNCTTAKSLQRSNSRPSSAKLPAPRKASGVGPMTSKQKEAAGSLSGACNTGAPKRATNPLSNSAPSSNKTESKRVGTSSMRASTRSLPAVDSKRSTQISNSLHSKSMAATSSADKRTVAGRKASTRKVLIPPIKDQGKPSGKNAKDTSLLSATNEGAKEGPKNFLRKGTGSSRFSERGGVLQPKSVNNKEVGTMYKGARPIASPTLGSQTSVLASGLELRNDPPECLLAQQVDATGGTPHTDGYTTAAKRESVKGVKRKGHDDITLSPEEPSPLCLSNNMQPDCCTEVRGSNQSGESQAGAACLDGNLRVSSFSLAEPFLDSLPSNIISIRCDPFEIPTAQERVLAEARFSAQGSSTHHFMSGISDVMRSTSNYQQLRMKGDASRITSSPDQHVSASNHGKDLKWFLKFGWRNTHSSTAGSDQASASIFSEEDEDKGSFSEPGPKILDCYGRNRHGSGKAAGSRVSGLHTDHCSPSTSDHDESKGCKTIILLKRSISTHEVRSKPNVKTSAVKATRAFFSLAPFRRKSVEAK